jgi:hypothetical protein
LPETVVVAGVLADSGLRGVESAIPSLLPLPRKDPGPCSLRDHVASSQQYRSVSLFVLSLSPSPLPSLGRLRWIFVHSSGRAGGFGDIVVVGLEMGFRVASADTASSMLESILNLSGIR